jgi:hypothetical protein
MKSLIIQKLQNNNQTSVKILSIGLNSIPQYEDKVDILEHRDEDREKT